MDDPQDMRKRAADRPALEEFQAAAELRAAIRLFQRRSEEIARRHGLTPQRFLLLLMIKGAPEGTERSTVTALTERLQLAQSTVTELVARAKRAGLLNQETDRADARVSHLSLTAEGSRRLAAVVKALGPEHQRLQDLLRRLAGP